MIFSFLLQYYFLALRLQWQEGHDFIFDDTCIHYVVNHTNKRRVSLILDFVREDMPTWTQKINYFILNYIVAFVEDVRLAVKRTEYYFTEKKKRRG